jgi:hypothetical protein
MRATINFDVGVDQVEDTMAVLACSEEHNLRAAADILGNYTVLDGSVLEAITEVLRLLDSSANQLRQYQQMMVSFERARYETLMPQPANNVNMELTEAMAESESADVKSFTDLQAALDAVQGFESFMGPLSNESAGPEKAEDDEPQEG